MKDTIEQSQMTNFQSIKNKMKELEDDNAKLRQEVSILKNELKIYREKGRRDKEEF